MSGLLALLDDVAAIAKLAAASLDDIAAAAAKAGTKTAGILIDDAAVTPKYVHGFAADRELPIIWRIARGSIWNKLIVLLPALMLLTHFLPQAVTPLLMLGGCYLCFEGAEKVWHVLFPLQDGVVAADFDPGDPARLEEERVAGAIKTDFILSAEIMTISLGVIEKGSLWMQGATLAAVAVMVTAAVYGAVALIVKMDDVGLFMARRGRTRAARSAGRGLVVAMPRLMTLLAGLGTAAMLWVGGNIVIHGMQVLGWPWPYDRIHDLAGAAAQAVPQAGGFMSWLVTAALDGFAGLILGVALIPVATRLVAPLWSAALGKTTPAP